MPPHIVDLYVYFLYYGTKQSREAFERFYDSDSSRQWVRRYAVRGKIFYSDYMTKYSQEIRALQGQAPFQGIMTPRGVLKC